MLSRRRFLTAAAGLAGLAGAPRLVWAATTADGFTVLRAQGGTAPLLGDQGDPTAIWGYNGQCPGPTLRVRQGETLKVRLVNRLLEPTSIHWYGVRLPNAMDGTALTQEPVAPGASFDYVFAPPDAGTFWYHAQINASEQVGRGLYGALIVEEESSPDSMADPMHDVVMMIDDWWLFDSGAINEEAFGDLLVASHGGRMGNWMTVNGTSRPTIAAPAGERLRLRLVNAANARVMRLTFRGADPRLLAIDGQPLGSPQDTPVPLVLPPGARADVGLPRGLDQVIVAVDIEGEPLELVFIDREHEPEPEPEPEPEAEPEPEPESEPEPEPEDKGEEASIKAKVVSVPKAKPVAKPIPMPMPKPKAAADADADADAEAEAEVKAKVVSKAKSETKPEALVEIEPDSGDFAPLPANPLPATLDVANAVAVDVVMEGGASGGMTGAIVDGEHLSMRELVGHGMTWAINGIAGGGEDPLVAVERGRTVVLSVSNKTAWTHALHLHGHHVRVVEEDGRAIDDGVWRDTVLVEPRAELKLAFVADNPGRWLLQCRVLEHGEAGMKTWLEVT